MNTYMSMLSEKTIQTILGLEEGVEKEPKQMAKQVILSFYPIQNLTTLSAPVLAFAKQLEETLIELGVRIIPYREALENVPTKKRIKRLLASLSNNVLYLFEKTRGKTDRVYIDSKTIKGILKKHRIRPGVSVIALGENEMGHMPIDVASSFRLSSVITILDKPKTITEQSNFYDHFDTAMRLFAFHMTNIVIVVDKENWVVYNFNASHPFYKLKSNFKHDVLYGLLPKIAAPIRPYRFSDFTVIQKPFDSTDSVHSPLVRDLVESGPLFESFSMYPPGKKISDLPFRNKFYAWIGQLHLDHRTGMSYGFLANQMPVMPSPLIPFANIAKELGGNPPQEDLFYVGDDMYIVIEIKEGKFALKVPEVWLISQRSGANKTNMDPIKDVVKIGLKNGIMYIQAPKGVVFKKDYKPSFDTGVMLAHSVGNAIIASILNYTDPTNRFLEHIMKHGMALSHWHGYINPSHIPEGWSVHGIKNPHVACSSPQSALYALEGKLRAFSEARQQGLAYRGDIHIEPHHGTNISYPTQKKLAELIGQAKDFTELGNKYLPQVAIE